MTKITELTPEQVAKFPEYVREWTAHGLCTDPADRPRAEAAIRWMYAQAGLDEPRIVWKDSPLAGIRAVAEMKDRALVRASVWSSVRDSVWDTVWDTVRDSVWSSVRDAVWETVQASVQASVRDSVQASVRASVMASVRFSIRNFAEGQHAAHIVAFHEFFRTECGLIHQTDPMKGITELCKSCGWIFPYAGICIATERHNVCKPDAEGRVHCEDGPAIAYPDGFQVHAWHGVKVPKDWIEDKARLSPETVLSTRDIEQRRAGCEIIGWDAIIEKLGGKVIAADDDPQIGTLVEVNLPGAGPTRFIRVLCGTGRRFALCVPPTVTTPLEAQAALFGMTINDFTPPSIRT